MPQRTHPRLTPVYGRFIFARRKVTTILLCFTLSYQNQLLIGGSLMYDVFLLRREAMDTSPLRKVSKENMTHTQLMKSRQASISKALVSVSEDGRSICSKE